VDKIIYYESSPVFYRIEGDGFPVILIHGFAEDGTIWQNQIAHLAKSYKLVIPDLPGSSHSFFNAKLATVEDFADCIQRIVDEEKIATCVIIGHSLGGYVTLAFAEKYPKKLNGLGLFHSTVYGDNEEKKAARKKGIEFIKRYGAAEFIKQSVPKLFAEDFNKKHPEIVNELIDRYNNFNPGSLVSYYDAMMKRPDRTRLLKSFKKPVLFIAGEKDNAVPIEHSLQQSYLPEICYFHVLVDTAHMGMFETMNLSNEIISDFLEQAIQ